MSMDVSVSKLVIVSYLGVALVSFIIFDKLFDWIWISFEALNQVAIIGNALTLTSLLAVFATAILIFWMKRHPEVDPFIHETVIELRKVTWPGWKDTQRSTIIVIAFSVTLATSLWLMDQVWQRVTDYILTFGI